MLTEDTVELQDKKRVILLCTISNLLTRWHKTKDATNTDVNSFSTCKCYTDCCEYSPDNVISADILKCNVTATVMWSAYNEYE